jgi:hypothetical protein
LTPSLAGLIVSARGCAPLLPLLLATRASGGMADAHGSGPCVRKDVGVQLPPRPPRKACVDLGFCRRAGTKRLCLRGITGAGVDPPRLVPRKRSLVQARASLTLSDPHEVLRSWLTSAPRTADRFDGLATTSSRGPGRMSGAPAATRSTGPDGRYAGAIDGDRVVYRSVDSASISSPFARLGSAGTASASAARSAVYGEEPNLPD